MSNFCLLDVLITPSMTLMISVALTSVTQRHYSVLNPFRERVEKKTAVMLAQRWNRRGRRLMKAAENL